MGRQYGLRDDQWKTIETVLHGREETVGVTAKDNRLFVEAVVVVYVIARDTVAKFTGSGSEVSA